MKIKYNKITVLGCGAWATTIANHIAKNGFSTTMWCYRKAIADDINKDRKREKLNNILLDQALQATDSIKEALDQTDAIILCVPSCFLHDVLEKMRNYFDITTPILCLIKGIASTKHFFINDLCKDILGPIHYSVLSGPNLALEIAQEKPAAAVIASTHQDSLLFFQKILSNNVLRIYTSHDVAGVACGGILKNIFAIAAGSIDALNLGYNTKATLITRSLHEMLGFSTFLNAHTKTLYGLSGLGDLVATCHSSLSRNYQFGYQLVQEKSIEAVQRNLNAIAEGFSTTKYVFEFAKKHSIDMPITNKIYHVLYHNLSVKKAIEELMLRELKQE